MKAILTFYLASMLVMNLYAQQPDKTLIKVEYNFIHVRDTNKRDKPYTENMLLLAGKNAWLYTSYDKIDRYVNQQLQNQEMAKSGFTNEEINAQNRVRSASNKPTSATEYYFFSKENKFYSNENLTIQFMVEDTIEKIHWQVLKDTMSFLGVHCEKAIATYKGRNWTAWFTTDIPVASGPWKLNGLPGLIIDAYDDKKEVQFVFEGIEKVKDGDLATDKAQGLSKDYLNGFGKILVGLNMSQIALPQQREVHEGGYTKVTKKEYDKLKAESDKDPIAFRNAELTANGMGKLVEMMAAHGGNSGGGGGRSDANGNIQPTIKTMAPAPRPATITTNNPIELPDIK